MDIEISVRKINDNDLSKLLSIHKEAFDGYMNTKLGNGYIIAFLRWFTLQKDAIALTVEFNHYPQGYVVGASIGYGPRLSKAIGLTVIKYLIFHPWLFANKKIVDNLFSRVKSIFQTQTQPNIIFDNLKGISLVGIGVSKSSRGQNLGTHLINAFEDNARELHFDYMRLSVYSDNEIAISFYTKNGWKFMAEQNGLNYFYKKII